MVYVLGVETKVTMPTSAQKELEKILLFSLSECLLLIQDNGRKGQSITKAKKEDLLLQKSLLLILNSSLELILFMLLMSPLEMLKDF